MRTLLIFYNEFEPILQKLSSSTSETIIAGDFNIDLLNISTNYTLYLCIGIFWSNNHE